MRRHLGGLAGRKIDGDVEITAGSHRSTGFGTNRRGAERTPGIPRACDATHMCHVGRPDAPLTYVLAGGSAPTGAVVGEDRIRHDLGALYVQEGGGPRTPMDARSRMAVFGGRGEADIASALMRHHGVTHIGHVGRTDPSFVRMRG